MAQPLSINDQRTEEGTISFCDLEYGQVFEWDTQLWIKVRPLPGEDMDIMICLSKTHDMFGGSYRCDDALNENEGDQVFPVNAELNIKD